MAPLIADIAIKNRFTELKDYIEKNKELPLETQLDLIRVFVDEMIAAAKTGYL